MVLVGDVCRTQYHTHVVNVSAYTEPITMSYHFADDCWQAPTDPCDDQIGTIDGSGSN